MKILQRSFLLILILLIAFPAAAKFQHTKRKAYKKILKTHTQGNEVYQRDDFYASMRWVVTYLDSPFQAALIDEVSRIYDYSPAQETKYAAESREKFSDNTVFFISFYAYDNKTADLRKLKNLWTLRVVTPDGKRMEPTKIDFINRPTPLDIELFPQVNTWSRHYYVYFPRIDAPTFQLQLNGPDSETTLSWTK
jgi:hypothetical protein